MSCKESGGAWTLQLFPATNPCRREGPRLSGLVHLDVAERNEDREHALDLVEELRHGLFVRGNVQARRRASSASLSPMAFLELLAGAAPAGIVAADLLM